ncbi:hypothetical protein NIES25_27760 [Nostoc linckia NIES-25]|nr:hypothetical protein NIES25_27760 [Nostoc linckia NIES-25]
MGMGQGAKGKGQRARGKGEKKDPCFYLFPFTFPQGVATSPNPQSPVPNPHYVPENSTAETISELSRPEG